MSINNKLVPLVNNKKLIFKEGPFTKEIKLETKHWEPVSEVKTKSLF